MSGLKFSVKTSVGPRGQVGWRSRLWLLNRSRYHFTGRKISERELGKDMRLVSLTVYLKLLEAEFSRLRAEIDEHIPLYDPSVRHRFLESVEKLESRREFKDLAKEIAQEFGKDEMETATKGFWEFEAKAFFRLAGIYERALREDALPLVDISDDFEKEFRLATAQQTTLALIEFVEFSKDTMQFDSFAIRRFTKDELDKLLRQHACRLFYPWAVVDTKTLSDYWFIVSIEEKPIASWARLAWNTITPQYSPFSGATKDAFRVLSLYKWSDRFNYDVNLLVSKFEREHELLSSVNPQVPFTIQISQSFRETPRQAPDISKLATQPVFDSEGEEVGETRVVAFDFGDYEPKPFIDFTTNVEKLLRTVTPKREWRFMKTALNFLEKGFIDNGLEQLLWHITAVEALLGEKVESGLTALLKNRVARILGDTESKRKAIRKAFENLYSVRSDYIHGNVKLADREILHVELAQAREFARAITLWMLFYLNHILESDPSAELPSRENLLAILDMEESSRQHLAKAISRLPNDFPSVTRWSDRDA
jgi:hypothetical protein